MTERQRGSTPAATPRSTARAAHAWMRLPAEVGENALRDEEGHAGHEEAHCDGSHRADSGTDGAFDEPPGHGRGEHGSQSGHVAVNR